MTVFNIQTGWLAELDSNLRGLLQSLYSERFSEKEGVQLKWVQHQKDSGIRFTLENGGTCIHIHCASLKMALHGLGILLRLPNPLVADQSLTLPENEVGFMVDLSRNRVLTVEALKALMIKLVLLGYDYIGLYAEDLFHLKEYPSYGYMRGRYSDGEIREIVAFASLLDLEVIPFVQTLGHMKQFLRWGDVSDLVYGEGILDPFSSRSRHFLSCLIGKLADLFGKGRVHLGADEAHDFGLKGFTSGNLIEHRIKLLTNYLNMLAEISEEAGVRPMIWSDMLFRIYSRTQDYYDRDVQIDEEGIGNIVGRFELVYWDYYHWQTEHYEHCLEAHQRISKNLTLAVGGWTWGRFAPLVERYRCTIKPALEAVRKQSFGGNILLTTWFDDGSECLWAGMDLLLNEFSCEVLQAVASVETGHWVPLLPASDPGADFWKLSGSADLGLAGGEEGSRISNLMKILLWEDPLFSFVSAAIGMERVKDYLDLLRNQFSPYIKRGTDALPVRFYQELLTVLEAKLNVMRYMQIQSEDRDPRCSGQDVCQLFLDVVESVDSLETIHCDLWHKDAKNPGWEVLQLRYSGLSGRYRWLADMSESMRSELISNRQQMLRDSSMSQLNTDIYYRYHQLRSPSVVG